MAEDGRDGMDELRLPFVFVPHGAPEPVEFMRSCAEPLRIPATFRPDPQPLRTHPDAYLPTGTRTAEFPHGTPACLGLIEPGCRRHSRFPHGGAPPQTDPKYRADPVAEYHRFNRMADQAARNDGSPDASGLIQASTTTAEIIQQYRDVVDASRRTLADGTTGLSLPETGAGPALAVKPAATTPEEVGSRHPAEHQADPKQQLFERNVGRVGGSHPD